MRPPLGSLKPQSPSKGARLGPLAVLGLSAVHSEFFNLPKSVSFLPSMFVPVPRHLYICPCVFFCLCFCPMFLCLCMCGFISGCLCLSLPPWLRGTPGPPPGKSPLMPRELLEPNGNSSMAPWTPQAQVRSWTEARGTGQGLLHSS